MYCARQYRCTVPFSVSWVRPRTTAAQHRTLPEQPGQSNSGYRGESRGRDVALDRGTDRIRVEVEVEMEVEVEVEMKVGKR